MGVRFRKRINLYNISRQGVRDAFSVPGTGVSYQTERVGAGQRQWPLRKRSSRSASPGSMVAFVAVTVVILRVLAHLH
ncbi:MAG TPA: hypothetical protein VFO40_12240 [Chthoniobacterales bacterium]|nr:hypothetical protein [Chthoniobacterales bacterium]